MCLESVCARARVYKVFMCGHRYVRVFMYTRAMKPWTDTGCLPWSQYVLRQDLLLRQEHDNLAFVTSLPRTPPPSQEF